MDVFLCRGSVRFLNRGLFAGLSLALCLWGQPVFSSEFETNMSIEDDPLVFHADILGSGETGEASAPICEGEVIPRADESEEDFRFRMLLSGMLRDEPMEVMVPYLAQRDQETAAFLVSIARKESSWGEHAPSKDGIDCFNYWGYKGMGSRGAGMGYACFASPEEAVETVGNRIAELVHERNLNSPERLIVWKCGSSCAGHSPESVAKWISDVRGVYSRFF